MTRCLRKDPSRRFQVIADVKVALKEVQEDYVSGQLVPSEPLMKPNRRRGLLALIAAALIAASGTVAHDRIVVNLGDSTGNIWMADLAP